MASNSSVESMVKQIIAIMNDSMAPIRILKIRPSFRDLLAACSVVRKRSRRPARTNTKINARSYIYFLL